MQEPPTISITLQSLIFPLPPDPFTVKPKSFPIQKHSQSSTTSTSQNLPTRNNTSAWQVTCNLREPSFVRRPGLHLARDRDKIMPCWHSQGSFCSGSPFRKSEGSRITFCMNFLRLILATNSFQYVPSSFISYYYMKAKPFQKSAPQGVLQSNMAYTVLFLLIIFLTSSEQASKQPAPIDPFEFPEPAPRSPEHPLPAEGIHLMYYEQYKKIYNTSFRLHGQASKQAAKHLLLSQKIAQIETQLTAFDRRKRSEEVEEITERTPEGPRRKDRKRNRRTAEQIVRRYECPHQYCDRCYGSEGSLQQHLKLKHPQLYQREEDESEM